ncbi:MAG: hypothetical protein Q4B90_01325 [Eubacteriales bacterium]|nr:hypothetical protein [Eubacteriales bacterium]
MPLIFLTLNVKATKNPDYLANRLPRQSAQQIDQLSQQQDSGPTVKICKFLRTLVHTKPYRHLSIWEKRFLETESQHWQKEQSKLCFILSYFIFANVLVFGSLNRKKVILQKPVFWITTSFLCIAKQIRILSFPENADRPDTKAYINRRSRLIAWNLILNGVIHKEKLDFPGKAVLYYKS